MAKRQEDRVFFRLTTTAAKLRMWEEHGDAIFSDDAERADLMRDAAYSVRMLMDFRNIVNGMVSFEDEPKDTARFYVE